SLPRSNALFFSITSRVLPMPLRSPMVNGPAPIEFNFFTIAASVCSLVEPGVASALLKLGLRKRSLPWNLPSPRRSIAWATPLARSVVFTKATWATPLVAPDKLIDLSKPGATITAPPSMDAFRMKSLRFIAATSPQKFIGYQLTGSCKQREADLRSSALYPRLQALGSDGFTMQELNYSPSRPEGNVYFHDSRAS